MGTRNLTCVVVDKEFRVAQYAQWDGYPEGQGAAILEFLQENRTRLDEFREKVRALKTATPEDLKAATKAAGCDDSGWMNMEQAATLRQQSPAFSRETGADVLGLILEGKVTMVHLKTEFARASLFCEWAYVVDLDQQLFEVYKGFVQTKSVGRFAEQPGWNKPDEHGYYPVRLRQVFHFDQLPDEAEFVAKCTASEDDDEDDEEEGA